ncbi:hypothetical protein SH591_15160 [Sphingomonas sp. LY54]|uniref:hypothetical protein n=1 Tax=Sphingomonas sp. LY54 TaxID=3095343 RepID=UPI002D76F117|nr:hypothetical protein [Sphingomonas sp. LY54]WRP30288.1 hypothetical protein SH591_15160 [Sphingomonas sp. LY54]
MWGVNGIAAIDLSDNLKLTSISAYREFDSLEIFDADGLSLPMLTAAEDARGEQTSQELRLAFDNGGAVTAFVGASYFKEKGSQRTPAQFDERMALARLANVLNGPIPGRPAADPAPPPSSPTPPSPARSSRASPRPMAWRCRRRRRRRSRPTCSQPIARRRPTSAKPRPSTFSATSRCACRTVSRSALAFATRATTRYPHGRFR